jgi:DNA-directed RNA polymerase subunit RPC12/RpoP
VAVRICPHCKTEIPAPEAAVRTNDIECPKCRARLEVAPGSRTIATLAGLVAGTVAFQLSNGSTSDLGGVLPTLSAFLAFGVVSGLVVMFTANLRNAPAIPAPQPAHANDPVGHGAGSHVAGHH